MSFCLDPGGFSCSSTVMLAPQRHASSEPQAERFPFALHVNNVSHFQYLFHKYTQESAWAASSSSGVMVQHHTVAGGKGP